MLGTPVKDDVLVYEDLDETYYVGLSKTRSKQFILVNSGHTLRNEVHFLDANQPHGEFQVIEPRSGELEYSVDHHSAFRGQDSFLLRTNLNARNFRLMAAPVSRPGKANWSEVVPHRPDVFLARAQAFQDHLVLMERSEGLMRMRLDPVSGGGAPQYIEMDEPAYAIYPSANPSFAANTLRYVYTSLTTPSTTVELQLENGKEKGERRVLKQAFVGPGKHGAFDAADYVTERLWAPARDGAKVPVSLVYRKGFREQHEGGGPLLLYAYGSYGSTTDPTFSHSRLALLDRGFAYAIAHIRGGQSMGFEWYEQGRQLKKKNTFFDFIDVGKYLIDQGLTNRNALFARGGSAGGLLMGAVINYEPSLFQGVIAAVPFVDVITTMLDESIPLTTGEWDEWGDPHDKTYFDYMLSYSPYDQVEAKAYPNLLVTTGLHDSQVQYWEPAKWVARLRRLKTDDNLLLLKTNMKAGHGGASGRFGRYRDTALEYAFMLDLVPEP